MDELSTVERGIVTKAWADCLHDDRFDPDRACPDCGGHGSSMDSDDQFCPKCKGTGVDFSKPAGPARPPEPQLPEGVYVA